MSLFKEMWEDLRPFFAYMVLTAVLAAGSDIAVGELTGWEWIFYLASPWYCVLMIAFFPVFRRLS